jgi:hypothetical protein
MTLCDRKLNRSKFYKEVGVVYPGGWEMACTLGAGHRGRHVTVLGFQFPDDLAVVALEPEPVALKPNLGLATTGELLAEARKRLASVAPEMAGVWAVHRDITWALDNLHLGLLNAKGAS